VRGRRGTDPACPGQRRWPRHTSSRDCLSFHGRLKGQAVCHGTAERTPPST
jgi:hypothetical protein